MLPLPRFVTDRVAVDNHGDMESWQRPLSRYSRHRIFNLTRPEKSLALLAPLARGVVADVPLLTEFATTDEQRERLMPHNRRWPIAALLDASGFRSISVEQIAPMLLVGGCSSVDDAAQFLFRGAVVRAGRISWSTACLPARATCHAASATSRYVHRAIR